MTVELQAQHLEFNCNLLKSVSIQIGDNVKIGVKIIEGNRERVQFYRGLVISIKNVSINKMITVRRVFQGIGMERLFLLSSPKISSIEILNSSKVRRSKLYYIRLLKGKASKLKKINDQ
jgi:large subunit ribosomal protein L19